MTLLMKKFIEHLLCASIFPVNRIQHLNITEDAVINKTIKYPDYLYKEKETRGKFLYLIH